MRTQVNNITRLKQRKTGVIYCILFTGGVIRDIWTNQRNSFFFFFFHLAKPKQQRITLHTKFDLFQFSFFFPFFQLLAHSFFKGGDVSGLKKFNPGPVSGIFFSLFMSDQLPFLFPCTVTCLILTLKYIEIPSVVN